MQDFLNIGSTPPDETCAQIGEVDYDRKSRIECNLYIEALREKLGDEPDGARLAIKGFDHDFGRYYEVVCHYNDENEEATEYAYKCESDGPLTWAEVEMIAPKFN